MIDTFEGEKSRDEVGVDEFQILFQQLVSCDHGDNNRRDRDVGV
jgi:hypothetical protein